jgi:hypothetical protein
MKTIIEIKHKKADDGLKMIMEIISDCLFDLDKNSITKDYFQAKIKREWSEAGQTEIDNEFDKIISDNNRIIDVAKTDEIMKSLKELGERLNKIESERPVVKFYNDLKRILNQLDYVEEDYR